MLLYLRQEGRGIGFLNKIRAYGLQDLGLDTVEANIALGFRDDERDYSVAAHMVHSLKVKSVRLMTNNPKKIGGLQSLGVKVTGRIPLIMPTNKYNEFYLKTKKEKSGHLLEQIDRPVLGGNDHRAGGSRPGLTRPPGARPRQVGPKGPPRTRGPLPQAFSAAAWRIWNTVTGVMTARNVTQPAARESGMEAWKQCCATHMIADHRSRRYNQDRDLPADSPETVPRLVGGDGSHHGEHGHETTEHMLEHDDDGDDARDGRHFHRHRQRAAVGGLRTVRKQEEQQHPDGQREDEDDPEYQRAAGHEAVENGSHRDIGAHGEGDGHNDRDLQPVVKPPHQVGEQEQDQHSQDMTRPDLLRQGEVGDRERKGSPTRNAFHRGSVI